MNHLNLVGCRANSGIQAEGRLPKPDLTGGLQGKGGGLVPEPTLGEALDDLYDQATGGEQLPSEEVIVEPAADQNWLLEQVSANPVMWTLGIVGTAWLLMGRK